MTVFRFPRPQTDQPGTSSRSGFSWVTMLTASPTWVAITRCFRPGAYPYQLPSPLPDRSMGDATPEPAVTVMPVPDGTVPGGVRLVEIGIAGDGPVSMTPLGIVRPGPRT